MILLWGLIAVILVCYIINRILSRDLYKAYNQFPGPSALPFLGQSAPFMFADTKGVFNRIYQHCKEYDRFFRVWIPVNNFALICYDYRDMEVFLSSNTQIDKGDAYDFVMPWIGEGLLTSRGQKWRSHRKIITPTFHFKILESFVDIFNRNGSIMCEKLQSEVGKDPFNIYNYINLAALDNIYETAMGVNMNIQRNSETTYVRAIKDLCYAINKRVFKFYLRPNWIYRWTSYYKIQQNALKTIHSATDDMIQQRRREIAARNKLQYSQNDEEENEFYQKKRLAFLDLLIESAESANLSDQDIREEVDTFMFEGHDTISSGLSFALCALANNPEVQEKVYQEQLEIFGDSDRPPSYNDLQNMKYLERALKESQRLYPSVPTIAREMNERVELPGGYVLPKGSQISLMIFALHRDPKIWSNPDEFNPDNFLPDAVQGRNPYCYVPFSAGARNCIGQKFAMLEMKATISKMVRQYKLLPSPYEHHKLDIAAELVLISLNGFHIKIQKRE